MTSAAKDQGTRFESEVVEYFKGWGFPARRTVQTQALDLGDIEGVPDFTLQCKSGTRLDLPQVMDATKGQAQRAQTPHGAIVWKRQGRMTKDALVIMDAETFAKVLYLLSTYRDYRRDEMGELTDAEASGYVD